MAEFQSRNHNTLYLARVLGHVDRPPVFRGALKVAPGRLAHVQEVGAQPADGKLGMENLTKILGDPSGCLLSFVDIKTKVALQYMLLLPKCDFCFDIICFEPDGSPCKYFNLTILRHKLIILLL